MPTQYENAPITEAVIDFRVRTRAAVSVTDLAPLKGLLSPEFPSSLPIREDRVEYDFGARQTSTTSGEIGLRFTSKAEDEIFQAQVGGFSLSKLRPYRNWDQLIGRARELWPAYCDAAKVETITRVAVRYINRIDIPFRPFETKDYFNTGPEIAHDLPQELSDFFVKLHMPQSEFEGMLVFTLASVPGPSPSVSSVVIDIDVFRNEVAFASDSEEAWSLLDVLRQRKNQYFESCITDRARALFGERRTY